MLSFAVTVGQQFKPKVEKVNIERKNLSLACCLNPEHDPIESDSSGNDFEPNHLEEEVEEIMEEGTSREIIEQVEMVIVKSFLVMLISQMTEARLRLWKN